MYCLQGVKLDAPRETEVQKVPSTFYVNGGFACLFSPDETVESLN